LEQITRDAGFVGRLFVGYKAPLLSRDKDYKITCYDEVVGFQVR
jgi:hypothetical protein